MPRENLKPWWRWVFAIPLWLSIILLGTILTRTPIAKKVPMQEFPDSVWEMNRKFGDLPIKLDPQNSQIIYSPNIWRDRDADKAKLLLLAREHRMRPDSLQIDKLFSDVTYHYWRFAFALWATLVILPEGLFLAKYAPSPQRKGPFRQKCWHKFWRKSHDIRIVLLLIALTGLLSYGLFLSGIFRSPRDDDVRFWHTELGFLTLIGLFLGVAGSIYALYAKLVADDVFEKTTEIHNTIFAFFTNLDSAMDATRDKSIPGLIESSRRSLKLYLGCPVVGFFRSPALGTSFVTALAKRIDRLDHNPGSFTIELIYWSEIAERAYINEYRNSIVGKTPQEIEGAIRNFSNACEFMLRRIGEVNGRVWRHRGTDEPAMRFIIADDSKAIVWILERPTAVDAIKENIEGVRRAGGFTTETSQMVDVLLGVFETSPRSPGPAP